MSAIGNVGIFMKVGDAAPIQVGSVEIKLRTVSSDKTGVVLKLDRRRFRRDMRRFYRAAAKAL
jgi:hypothetical protein